MGRYNRKFSMIEYIKDKYYWWLVNNKLKNFFSRIDQEKILLFGYPKSGNTWVRFLLFNYMSLLKDKDISKTITYDKLNMLQNNVMDRATTYINTSGFPLFYRTHKIYKKPYNLFDFKIFIHRNPLDTLVSAYYFYKNREIPFPNDSKHIRSSLNDIDFYVKYKIQEWINFYFISVKKADYILNYSDLKRNCFDEIKFLIIALGWDVNLSLIKKSVEISTFSSIKEMSINNNQQYGNAPKDGSFKGVFNRSGVDCQYVKELKKETIEYVINKFPEFTKLYSF